MQAPYPHGQLLKLASGQRSQFARHEDGCRTQRDETEADEASRRPNSPR